MAAEKKERLDGNPRPRCGYKVATDSLLAQIKSADMVLHLRDL